MTTATPTATDLIARLAALDPAALDWHAARYDAADQFQDLIVNARWSVGRSFPAIAPEDLPRHTRRIALACRRDGAATGMIGCLGGPHLTVWIAMLAAYMPKCEGYRLYHMDTRDPDQVDDSGNNRCGSWEGQP